MKEPNKELKTMEKIKGFNNEKATLTRMLVCLRGDAFGIEATRSSIENRLSEIDEELKIL